MPFSRIVDFPVALSTGPRRTGISPDCNKVSANQYYYLSKQNISETSSLIPVGVKKAGMPAPPARILSAIVPCGQSSIAISPLRYFFSRNLFAPRNERINRSICPDATSGERPPPPAAPALLETAVRLLSPSFPLRSIAAMIVSTQRNKYQKIVHEFAYIGFEFLPAVPQSPNPALNITAPLFRSLTAASASLNTFDCPLMIFGAGSRFALVFACCSRRIDVVWKCRARGRLLGRKWVQGVEVQKALLPRVVCARQAEVILLVAIVYCKLYNSEDKLNKAGTVLTEVGDDDRSYDGDVSAEARQGGGGWRVLIYPRWRCFIFIRGWGFRRKRRYF